MDKKTKWYDEVESNLCVLIIIFMIAILTYQVGARYIFQVSYPWIDELSRYALIWFAYLSASYAIVHNAHIKIDLFLKVWPKSWRTKIKLLSNVIFFVYAVAVAYFSTLWVMGLARTGTVSMGVGGSMALFSAIIPISHIFMAIRLVQLEIRLIKNPVLLEDRLPDEDLLEEVTKK